MSQPPGKRAGRVLMIVAWAAAMFLATRFFGQWEERQQNPNSVVQSEQGDGFVEVRLLSNGQGHFVADGAINGRPVHFMLDTGATDVAVPEALARDLELARGAAVQLSTANGRTQGYRTRLDSLQLGDIHLRDVRALVVPGLDGQGVLLGMSALKQLEFTQRGGTMLLRQNLK
ncbi:MULTISPECIES: TIGR02281 family clan AA aspartic protease [Pseudomonas]|jgi:aspartyl protease family protein|uniref:TIGR02281 family clan AA aspartic protease n=1 Tax=Pseudomonas soli TaxID=1306993 RepID=A0A2V4HWM6_9PSED|nr:MULTISPECIES: TIGR02281 family clan AA aspartic protease [Pseudomonas]PNA01653.1 TIGR02281 family clan AA aspartic protease [Pseudomonas sp. FW305-42]PNA25604.1 TIGR02281 family clan AA aspartic protease [Pseudomonas sp. MPR-R1B]PNB27127.1 TIGR02281 family clan AA aspartic protease [Pseudomonas sp. DP16D-E2]PNB44513.1 TIGR02281 family clan AA aspartic protease [Pseudomonas sp. FW305-17]PNB64741.1 TIGR02281 family clan AA aspartic protease [Pseudomonas sp. GW531-E2]